MAKIQIQSLVLGMVGTNVFFLQNTETKELILIDPSDRADVIDRKIQEMEGRPVAILLTHGHYDHILAADATAVVRHAEVRDAAVTDFHRDVSRSGIKGVFHQLLDDGGRPFNDFACSDQIRHMGR